MLYAIVYILQKFPFECEVLMTTFKINREFIGNLHNISVRRVEFYMCSTEANFIVNTWI
jgi:hypothetical protein